MDEEHMCDVPTARETLVNAHAVYSSSGFHTVASKENWGQPFCVILLLIAVMQRWPACDISQTFANHVNLISEL